MDMETETAQVKVIAHIRSDFSTKFGIPRQSGLVDELTARIVFTPALSQRGGPAGAGGLFPPVADLEFSKARREAWSPTVRPPGWGATSAWGCSPPVPLPPNPRAELCASAGIAPAHPGGAR